MHQSRLAGFIIDCRTQDLDGAARFWSAAPGLPLAGAAGDDLDAEAARLEQLGARRVATLARWIVMEAPTGQRFCIVRPQSPEFARHAHRWD